MARRRLSDETAGTPKNPRPRTRARARPAWQAKFLKALKDSHLVTASAERAGVARATVYRHRDEDPVFAAAWADVEEQSTEQLEQEAVKRATDGSDVLLIFLLKARRPDVYRDNHRIEHTGAEGGPIAAEIVTVDAKEAADAAHDFLARIAGPSA